MPASSGSALSPTSADGTTDMTVQMPEYWIVVRRGRADLLELLAAAFQGRRGFAVVEDRRTWQRNRQEERRSDLADWNDADFFVAERVQGLDW